MKKLKGLPILLGLALVYLVLWIFWPPQAQASAQAALASLKDVLLIMPAIVILMGLFEVWISREMVQKHMGSQSGIRGYLLAFLLGTAPTGPLYVAFPMAAGFLAKGARPAMVTFFLGTWATLKVPQLLMEVNFLGVSFAVTRFILTLVMLVLMGLIIERSLDTTEEKGPSSN